MSVKCWSLHFRPQKGIDFLKNLLRTFLVNLCGKKNATQEQILSVETLWLASLIKIVLSIV